MKYSSFANSDIQVSRVGYGSFGLAGVFGKNSEADSIDSVLHCLEQGVNFIDTASYYGEAEQIIGKALNRWKGDRPFIATKAKFYGPGAVGFGMPIPVQVAYPEGLITESLEESLQKMGLDSIDLLQLHQYWPQWDQADYWMEELIRLKEQGKVRFIGISIPDQRHDIALSIVKSGKIDSIQTVLNIFDPLAMDCLIPLCQENHVAVIARCVLDEGGLTGFLTEDIVFEKGDYRKSYFDCVPRTFYMEKVNQLKKFIPEHAESLAELSLKYVLHHPGVTTSVISMHVPKYADENIATVDKTPLSAETFEHIRKYHRWIRNFYDTKFW